MAEHDDFFPPDGGEAARVRTADDGRRLRADVHPGSGHAFMAPHNALGTQDQELYDQIWPEATAFLHAQLGG